MVERRFFDRRTSGARTGRRATDRRAFPPPYCGKPLSNEDRQHLVVIGCRGLAGANMARFLKLWAGNRLDVTLVEPDSGGASSLVELEESSDGFSEHYPYDRRTLASRYGIRIIGATVAGVDPSDRALMLGDGTRLAYDRLELAPGARLVGGI